jgi:branched-chain amino acid transport system substrate-binding protein
MQMLPAAIISAFKGADRIQYNPIFFGTWTSTDPDFFKLGKGLIRNRLKMQFPGGLPTDKTPGMKILKDLWKRYKTVNRFDASYWEGVAVGMIMERAFVRAQEKYGRIDRETINRAMESFRNEDFGGLIPKITYTAGNHEGSFMARIVQVHENGTYKPLTKFFAPGTEKPKQNWRLKICLFISEVLRRCGTSTFPSRRGNSSLSSGQMEPGKQAC